MPPAPPFPPGSRVILLPRESMRTATGRPRRWPWWACRARDVEWMIEPGRDPRATVVHAAGDRIFLVLDDDVTWCRSADDTDEPIRVWCLPAWAVEPVRDATPRGRRQPA